MCPELGDLLAEISIMSRSISQFDTLDALSSLYSTRATNELKGYLDKLPPEQKNLVEVQLELQRMQELTQLIGTVMKDDQEKSILRNFAV